MTKVKTKIHFTSALQVLGNYSNQLDKRQHMFNSVCMIKKTNWDHHSYKESYLCNSCEDSLTFYAYEPVINNKKKQ